jgi:hypothetical protein
VSRTSQREDEAKGMRRHLLVGTLAVALLVGSHALAGVTPVRTGPLVAADGHGLAPRFASFADASRVARRTAADGLADTLSHWGREESRVLRSGVGLGTRRAR